jgi:hypothetical protein
VFNPILQVVVIVAWSGDALLFEGIVLASHGVFATLVSHLNGWEVMVGSRHRRSLFADRAGPLLRTKSISSSTLLRHVITGVIGSWGNTGLVKFVAR